MKKLMFAAALCATVGLAHGSIESANIVGYGPTTLPASGLSVGPSFVTVSGAKIDLCDLKVVGYEEAGESYGDVQVQTLNGGGGTERIFVWYDYVDGDRIVGWFESLESGEYIPLVPGEVILEKGEGLWSVTMADGLSIQSAGEVATTADIPTPLPASGLTIANPTPVSCDLVDCYVTGYEKTAGESYGDVQVQTLNGGGGTERIFVWYDYVDGDRIVGWFESLESGEYVQLEAKDVVLAPGEGLWSVTMADDLFFCWPKVEIK